MCASASRIICCKGCAATAFMPDINMKLGMSMKPEHIRKWSRRVVSPIPAAAAALAPPLPADDVLRVLKCGHRFHLECIDRWLLSSTDYSRPPACPCCNKELD